MNELRSRPLFDLVMSLNPPQQIGATPLGKRRIFTVTSGTFQGDRLRGVVLPQSGADWLLERADGSARQDVRLVLQTDDGAAVLMTYSGVRHASAEVAARLARGELVDASEYYLRTAPFFETASEKYAWLNHLVSIAVGGRTPGGVAYRVFEIL